MDIRVGHLRGRDSELKAELWCAEPDNEVLIVLFFPLATTETRILDTELRPHLPLHGARGLAARTGRISTGSSSLGSAPQSVPVP